MARSRHTLASCSSPFRPHQMCHLHLQGGLKWKARERHLGPQESQNAWSTTLLSPGSLLFLQRLIFNVKPKAKSYPLDTMASLVICWHIVQTTIATAALVCGSLPTVSMLAAASYRSFAGAGKKMMGQTGIGVGWWRVGVDIAGSGIPRIL